MLLVDLERVEAGICLQLVEEGLPLVLGLDVLAYDITLALNREAVVPAVERLDDHRRKELSSPLLHPIIGELLVFLGVVLGLDEKRLLEPVDVCGELSDGFRSRLVVDVQPTFACSFEGHLLIRAVLVV